MIKIFVLGTLSLWLFIPATAHGATCSDIGFYCIENNRYQPVKYLEFNGGQYLDTEIAISSKYDMEMTWQGTKFVTNSYATGIWTSHKAPAIIMSGMYAFGSDEVMTAMYDIDADGTVGPEEISMPFDTNIHTTYCYKNKGIWIDDESTLKPANYDMDLPSDKNFLIGARITQGHTANYWYGRMYSFVFKDNEQIKAEFLPVYDTQSKEYGMYDIVSNKFFGNLGTQAFGGGDFIDEALTCKNAPDNAHYTSSGTADNCEWACNDGYGMHNGACVPLCASDISRIKTSSGLSFNLYPVAYSTPRLAVQHNDTVCYGVLSPGGVTPGININYNGTVYHMEN